MIYQQNCTNETRYSQGKIPKWKKIKKMNAVITQANGTCTTLIYDNNTYDTGQVYLDLS